MNTEPQEATNIQSSTTKDLFTMFSGFIVFISGFFLMAYSFFAWLLVANRYESLAYFCSGAVAAFVGRKIIRYARRRSDLINIS